MKTWTVLLAAASLSLYADEPEEIVALDLTEISQPISSELPPPPVVPPHKSSFLAVSLSALVPGLGHVYLGDMKTGSSLMGSACAGYGAAWSIGTLHSPDPTSLVFAGSIGMYSVYAAYRDVRIYNGNEGYKYPMPTDTLADLTYAPFQWSVLKKPEVWGGFLGALAIGSAITYFTSPKEAHIRFSLNQGLPLPVAAFPIGIGEESFFRGYLQSAFSEMASPWGGIAFSSLLFGLAHAPNALIFKEPHVRWRYYAFSLPFITAFGTYFGWMTYKNRSLKESVALHAWYDFTLLAAVFAASQLSAIKVPTSFGFSVPF